MTIIVANAYGFWGKKGSAKKEETKPKVEVQSSIGTETSIISGTETSPIFQTPTKELEPLPSCEKKKEAEEILYPKGRTNKMEREASIQKSSHSKSSIPDNDTPKPSPSKEKPSSYK
jgi:hypothetical protein